MENDSPTLDYCMRLLRCGSNAFTQFADVLIETKQNDTVDLLLNTTWEHSSFPVGFSASVFRENSKQFKKSCPKQT